MGHATAGRNGGTCHLLSTGEETLSVRIAPRAGGDQRGHERGERERPAHEQILHRPAPCDPEEPHADVEEERRVCREERDVDGMERRPQNSALRLTKTFRVAAGKKYGTSSKVYPDVS